MAELSDADVFGTTGAAPPAAPSQMSDADVFGTPQQTTWRGVAKNAAAATAEDVPAGLMNFAADPGGTLLHPLVVAGGTAYDAVAPYLGLPRMSPDLRSALYDLPPPVNSGGTPAPAPSPDLPPGVADYVNKYATPPGQTPPPDLPIGTRVMNAVDAAVLPPERSATTLPATPPEAMVRRGVGAAATVATMGPGGPSRARCRGHLRRRGARDRGSGAGLGRSRGWNWRSTRSLRSSLAARPAEPVQPWTRRMPPRCNWRGTSFRSR